MKLIREEIYDGIRVRHLYDRGCLKAHIISQKRGVIVPLKYVGEK